MNERLVEGREEEVGVEGEEPPESGGILLERSGADRWPTIREEAASADGA